jgi:monovalent cation:H+ antiporter-2, CPA2 family
LQDREIVETERGRIAVGWLIVEDIVMVAALVLIPAFAGLLGGEVQPLTDEATEAVRLGFSPIIATIGLTALKLAAFIGLMLIVGQRVIPWFLEYVANTGSRELFRLAVLSVALGVAYAAARLFGVSFALGAFFAGMVMAGSTLSAQAMRETLPLRDAFAVLFFVSVGMLFDPAIVVEAPFALIATVLVIVVVKSVAAFAITRSFGHGRETGLTIATSLAQIGEFSFILIVMGVDLDIVPPEGRDLVVAGAMLSILLNPVLFKALDRWAITHRDAAETP